MIAVKFIFKTALWIIVDLFVLILLLSTSMEIRAEVDCSGTGPLKFVWTAASGNVNHYNIYVSTDGKAYKLEGINYEPTYTITGVHRHSYRMKVEAADAAGNVGPMSEESDIVVCDWCSPLAITDFAASNPTTNSITLTWTAPGDDGNSGTASEYDIRYSTSTITETNWDDAMQVAGEPAPQPAGTSESFTVTALSSDTTYYFAIKIADEVPNWSGLSNVATGTTLDVTSPYAVTNLAASNPTTNSITLTWTASGNDGNSGTASEYDIRYSTSTITETNWDDAMQVAGEPAPQPAGTSESFTVTALSPDTTYYFAIKIADEVPNWSGLSNVATGKILDVTSPSAVTNLAASSPTANSITLTWTAPGNDGNSGTASEYDIRYSTSTITETNWDDAMQVTDEPAPKAVGSAESFVVNDLASGSIYYFAMKTADEVFNWSVLSNVVTSETLLTNVTSMSRVNKSGTLFDKRTGQYSMKATWTNIGADQFSKPLQIIIESITPATVTVANADGITKNGKPYYDYSNLVGDGKLNPGETSKEKQFVFNNPSRAKFEFNLSCWAMMEVSAAAPRIKLFISQAQQIHIVIPNVSALAQNFPNPFNPETWIPYNLAESSEVRIYIYDVQGKLVRTLYLGHKEIGQYFSKDAAAYWDGRNNLGERAGSGIYFYQIQAGDFQDVRKMAIVK